MTQDNHTEAADAQEQDSPVINNLRKERNDAIKEAKALAEKLEQQEANIRAQLAREMAVEGQLDSFGVPRGIRSVVEEKLGDAEVTPEGVAEALKAIGFELDEGDGASSQNADADSDVASDIAEVSGLSARVRANAKGGTPESDVAKIGKAQTREELLAAAEESGILQNNY